MLSEGGACQWAQNPPAEQAVPPTAASGSRREQALPPPPPGESREVCSGSGIALDEAQDPQL